MNPVGNIAVKQGKFNATLAALAAENARRRPCAECGMMILPEMVSRHYEIHHHE